MALLQARKVWEKMTQRQVGIGGRIIERIRSLPVGPDGWIEVDLPAIGRQLGARNAKITSQTVRDLSKRGVVEVRMKHARRIEAVRFLYDADEPKSMKETLVGLLSRYADKRGNVRTDTRQIARQTGLSDHDLAKMLFDLRSENVISFRKSGSDATMRIRGIKLLNGKAGKARAAILAPTPEPEPEPVESEVAPEAPTVAPTAADFVGRFRQQHYPLILQLSMRQANIEEAARRLEAAGLEDESILLLEKIDALSPLEKEVVALIEQLGWNK